MKSELKNQNQMNLGNTPKCVGNGTGLTRIKREKNPFENNSIEIGNTVFLNSYLTMQETVIPEVEISEEKIPEIVIEDLVIQELV